MPWPLGRGVEKLGFTNSARSNEEKLRGTRPRPVGVRLRRKKTRAYKKLLRQAGEVTNNCATRLHRLEIDRQLGLEGGYACCWRALQNAPSRSSIYRPTHVKNGTPVPSPPCTSGASTPNIPCSNCLEVCVGSTQPPVVNDEERAETTAEATADLGSAPDPNQPQLQYQPSKRIGPNSKTDHSPN